MTTIRYSLLAEGVLEYYFIPKLLNKIGENYDLSFVLDKNTKIKQSSNYGKGLVYQKVQIHGESVITRKIPLLVIGLDLDSPDWEHELSQTEKEKIIAKLPKKFPLEKLVTFIPVQSTDYWLLYQAYKCFSVKKYAKNSLESWEIEEIKQVLYGSSKPKQARIFDVCDKILTDFDVEELSNFSYSFKDFYSQIQEFIYYFNLLEE